MFVEDAPVVPLDRVQRQDSGMEQQPVTDQDELGKREIAWQFYSATRHAEAARQLDEMGL